MRVAVDLLRSQSDPQHHGQHAFVVLCVAQTRNVGAQRLKARNADAVRASYEQLRDVLVALERDPRERAVYDHFDPLAWVESKLNGRPFAERVRQRAGQRPLGTDDRQAA